MGGGISAIPGEGISYEIGQLVYADIQLDSWPGREHASVGLPDKFKLRLGFESLDFIDDDDRPLVQFPYQVIISWGHTAKSFRFSLPSSAQGIRGENSKGIENPPMKLHRENSIISICVLTPYGVGPVIDQCIMRTVLKLMDDMKEKWTVTKNEFQMLKRNILMPVRQPTEPVITDISTKTVVSDAGEYPSSPPASPPAHTAAAISGPAPIFTTAAPVPAVSNEGFPPIDMSTAELKEDWLNIITQFSASRKFIAKQAMELVTFIGPLAPFERIDLAEMLYDRILNKESFQLVVNAFEDKEERENLGHRLKLKGCVYDTHLVDC